MLSILVEELLVSQRMPGGVGGWDKEDSPGRKDRGEDSHEPLEVGPTGSGGHSKCENAGLNLEARREGKWRPLFILLASLAGILIVFICGLAMYL